MRLFASIAVLAPLAACGSSSPAAADAAAADAAPPTVNEVTCPATVPLTVDAPDAMLAYVLTPTQATIPVGGIVKFTMHATHNVVPNTDLSDPGLTVGFNATKCLQFTKAGSFGFHCGPHSFTATITVQ
jgi:plastocyanin